MNNRILITRRIPNSAAKTLEQAGCVVDIPETDAPQSREEILRRVADCAGVVTMLSDRIDAEFLDAVGDSLKIVANYAVGFDNIDLDECRRRGVRVSNTPGVLTEATADLAWTLILAAARRVVEGDQIMRAGGWPGWAPMELLGLELCGATLGIIGAGRIGAAVARRSTGFRMHVLYSDVRRNAELEQEVGAERADLERVIAEADVLSLHIPMGPEARHLIGTAQFASMKPTAILINTARGPIVDEAALVAALRDGQIAAAGLDVYENEPRLTPCLAELPNVVLLPHLGSATTATRAQMAVMAAENILAVLDGADPPNAVV